MNLGHALLLGTLQGLTEFIPVSSTAHLLIGQSLLNLPADEAMFSFTVLVQLGTLVSLLAFFYKDLFVLVKAFFAKPFSSPQNKLAWFMLIATLPAIVAGFFLKEVVETLFKAPLLEAAIRLLTAALVLTLAEWLGKPKRGLESMTWLDSLIVGLFQVLSVFPGASRSGTTISGGILRGFNRQAAARFAFLLSIPVMLAAGGYQTLDLLRLPDVYSFLPVIAVGSAAAAVIGWFSIKWLLGFLEKHALHVFALYCLLVGIIALVVHLL